MSQTVLETRQHALPAAEDWDILRAHFRDSVMAKTNLCSLAGNLGLKWPIRGKSETPERYINSTLAELGEMEEFYGKGNRLALLCTILRETKRLDDPYLDIARHLELETAGRDEPDSAPLLEQLGIPGDFPVALVNFTQRTLALCREGGHETLSQLVAFLQQSKTAVIINDEFREFRSCLDQQDAAGFGRYLPLRSGARGLFLAEAIAQSGRQLTDAEAATLVYAYKISTTNPAWGEGAVLPKAEALALFAGVKQAVQKWLDLLPDQADQLRAAIDSGLSSSVRFFVSLNDPDLEAVALAVAMAALDLKPRLKGGLFGNWLT